jgi:MYXO-CTERM domain-containing protein
VGYDVLAFELAGEVTQDPRERVWLAGGEGISDRAEDVGKVVPGMYRSVDGGCNWGPVGGALEGQWVSALSVDPEAPNVVIAGTRHNAMPNGIAVSQDAGATWAWTNAQGLPRKVNSLLRAPSDPRRLYASSSDRLWRSSDGGLTWEEFGAALITHESDELWVHAIDPEDPEVLYFSRLDFRGRPLFVTRDGGQSWGAPLFNAPTADFSALAVVVAEGGQRALYMGTGFGDGFRSYDSGQTWEEFFAEVPITCLQPDPTNPEDVYLCSNPFGQLINPEQRPFAVGRTSDGGERVDPYFAYADTTDYLECPRDSQIYTVCAFLDNPDLNNSTPDAGLDADDAQDAPTDANDEDTPQAEDDAGEDAAPDAPHEDAREDDASGGSRGKKGDGCQSAPSGSPSPWTALAALAALAWPRRSRRSEAARP